MSLQSWRFLDFTQSDTILTLCRHERRDLYIKNEFRASLVAQRLRIRLPLQGIRVQALVWEDPTCRGATKPVCHNY